MQIEVVVEKMTGLLTAALLDEEENESKRERWRTATACKLTAESSLSNSYMLVILRFAWNDGGMAINFHASALSCDGAPAEVFYCPNIRRSHLAKSFSC